MFSVTPLALLGSQGCSAAAGRHRGNSAGASAARQKFHYHLREDEQCKRCRRRKPWALQKGLPPHPPPPPHFFSCTIIYLKDTRGCLSLYSRRGGFSWRPRRERKKQHTQKMPVFLCQYINDTWSTNWPKYKMTGPRGWEKSCSIKVIGKEWCLEFMNR